MADFCTDCSKEHFGDQVKPRIDIQAIYDALSNGDHQPCLCEGCGMRGIVKLDGKLKILDGKGKLRDYPITKD